MQKIKEYNLYEFTGSNDSRFRPLVEIIGNNFKPKELINWLENEKSTANATEWVYVRKENGGISLYDVSDSMDETYTGEYLNPEKCFTMTIQNFSEIILQWEQLRITRPDIMLIVIHEDDHVSLESDPAIIKEYQDAGYGYNLETR